ncbi:MAG: hypothetical protein AB1410_09965 [Acidobacteriota bacterium]
MKAGRLILIIIFLIIFLIILGYFITKPNYDKKYFTKEYIEKYSSPEIAYYHYVNSLISTGPEYYQEVLGRENPLT